MSLDNIDDESKDSSKPKDKPEAPAIIRETTDTQIGNASAPAPAAQAAAPPPTGKPMEVPSVAKNRSARSRAGRNGGNKPGDGKSASGEGSAEGDGEEEPFRLPENIFNDIVAIATRDAANKAAKLVLEDVGFSNHVVMRTAEEVMRRCQAATKANEAERTPTQAAVLETTPVEEIVDAEVVEVIEETSAQKEKSTTAETPKKADDDSHGILIAIVVIIAIVILWFAFYPSSPDHRPSRRQTTSESNDTETDDTVAMSAARPIASSSSPTPEAIEAFTARVPYSRTERLIALRQLRGTGSDDERDMNCEGTGTNFSTRAFAERRTVDDNIDMRQLSQSEAQAYFADPAHTGELVVDAEGGPRTYAVYLDLRTRVNETGGGCNFYISN